MSKVKYKFSIGRKDREIMYFLFKNKIATSQAIKDSLFPNFGLRGLNLRIRRLIDEKYVERRYVSGIDYRPVSVVNLTPKGYKFFNDDYRSVKGIKLRSDKLDHDLMLLKVREHFSKIKNIENVWSENEIIINSDFHDDKHFDELNKVHSDAAIEVKWKNESFVLAVEYEASIKKSSRYHDKFISYYQKPSIAAVLYICATKRIYNTLIKLENKYNDSSKSKIYYIEINDFLKSKKIFPFLNRKNRKTVIFDEPSEESNMPS